MAVDFERQHKQLFPDNTVAWSALNRHVGPLNCTPLAPSPEPPAVLVANIRSATTWLKRVSIPLSRWTLTFMCRTATTSLTLTATKLSYIAPEIDLKQLRPSKTAYFATHLGWLPWPVAQPMEMGTMVERTQA